jgi:uncharacterized protein
MGVIMSDTNQYFNSQITGKFNEIYDYNTIIGSDGDFTRLSAINVLINSVRNLLLTPLGSYPFDPEYGSLLYKMLFEPSDSITQQQLLSEVKNRIQRYDPRVNIETIKFSYSNDKKTVSVNVIIIRGSVTGKVDIVLSEQQAMFGMEDSITAVNDISTSINSSNGTTSSAIILIFDSSTDESAFIAAMKLKYPLMNLNMIQSYWNTLYKQRNTNV